MGGEEGRDESPDSRRLGRKLGREIWGGENPKERSGPLRKRKEKKIGRKSEGEGGGEGGIGELEGETFEEWQLEGNVEKLERERAEGNKDFVERKDRN